MATWTNEGESSVVSTTSTIGGPLGLLLVLTHAESIVITGIAWTNESEVSASSWTNESEN